LVVRRAQEPQAQHLNLAIGLVLASTTEEGDELGRTFVEIERVSDQHAFVDGEGDLRLLAARSLRVCPTAHAVEVLPSAPSEPQTVNCRSRQQ
jgi:hypothetical protein